MRVCIQDGGVKDSLALFLVGDGEAGKTSVAQALVNEEDNKADEIGRDIRTVGSLLFPYPCISSVYSESFSRSLPAANLSQNDTPRAHADKTVTQDL